MEMTGLRQIRLDPERLKDKESLAQYMKDALELPDSFSGNLDALSDYLSEVTQETVFEVESGAFYLFGQEPWKNRLLQMVSRSAQDNPHLHLYLTDNDWPPASS